MYDRSARGYHPPSISDTRRQLIAAGLPFCSLQATTQHLQPMHLRMSKWKRYCSPASSERSGIRGVEDGRGFEGEAYNNSLSNNGRLTVPLRIASGYTLAVCATRA